MLIRLENDDLIEYPDEVGALALADRSKGDVLDFSKDELNLMVNALLAMFYEEELTLEENIEWARKHYTKWGLPTDSNMAKAHALIKFYNENVAPADIGYGPLELVKEFYGIESSKLKEEVYTVENMPNSPKKLIEHSDISEKTAQKFDENS